MDMKDRVIAMEDKVKCTENKVMVMEDRVTVAQVPTEDRVIPTRLPSLWPVLPMATTRRSRDRGSFVHSNIDWWYS